MDGDGRNVRPRGPGAAPGGELPAAVPASPLVAILEVAVRAGKVVKDPAGEVYTGFASYRDLASSQCAFVPMNSNRAINRDVVLQRVHENIDAFERTGRYMEFGQINLLVVASEASHDFLVMDGQHRCEAMQELLQCFPTRELWFQFRAKVVPSEPQAFEELRHFQRSYPTDSRSFFRSRAETRAATAVLLHLKAAYPEAFHKVLLSDRQGRRTGDPQRPYLNDNLVFWLLQDAELLLRPEAAPTENGQPARGETNAALVLSTLRQMDRLLAGLPRDKLGRGVSDNMRSSAARMNCWLGFFRDGYLHWRDVAAGLRAAEPSPAAAKGKGEPDSAKGKAGRPAAAAAAAASQCTVCLEHEADTALLPCGHRCVCQPCASAVRAARPPVCPLCHKEVASVCRIFLA